MYFWFIKNFSCIKYERYVGFRFIFNNNIQWARWLGYSPLWIADLLEYLYWKSLLNSTHFFYKHFYRTFDTVWMHYHIYMHLGIRIVSLYQFHTNFYFQYPLTKSNIMWIIFYGLDSNFLFRIESNKKISRLFSINTCTFLRT